MKIKYLKLGLAVVVGGFLLFGIQTQPTAQPINNSGQQPPDAMAGTAGKGKPKFVPGRFIVKFKSTGPTALNNDAQYLLKSNGSFQGAVSDGSDSLDKLNQKHNVKNARSLFVERDGLTTADAMQKQNSGQQLSKAMHQSRSQRAPKDAIIPDLSNVYILEVPLKSDIEGVVLDYQSDPHVEYAQPDYIIEDYMIPNDPYYDLWGLYRIQAAQAWDVTQGGGVVVAVVDGGLDYNHPDIAANVWTNLGEIPNNGVDDDVNGYVDDIRGWDFGDSDNNPMDARGHGTHVAGIIAAVGNNSTGIIGVAPKVKIMSVKRSSDSGDSSFSTSADAIVYAARNGADVINNSWGCSSACPSNPIAEDAVRTAYNLGAVVVFAAGNSSADVSNYSPQNMTNPKPIVVSATSIGDTPADFTSFGALVDVSAPGHDILSLKAANTTFGQGGEGTDYVYASGTSMAAAHVAGLAALVLSHHPSFSNEDVRQVLRASADDVNSPGFDVYTGAGRINAARALTISSPENPPPVLADIGNKSVNAGSPLAFTVSATDPDGDALTYSASGLPAGATFNTSTRAFSWTPTSSQAGNNYYVTFTVSDGSLTDTEVITITAGNAVVSTPPTAPGRPTAPSPNNGTFKVTWTASYDASGIAYYRVYRGGATGDMSLINTGVPTNSYTESNLAVGKYRYLVVAIDGTGQNSESPISAVIEVVPADIVMTAVSGPAGAATGTTISIANTIKNQGPVSAGSFSTGFYLSTDAVITTADRRIGTRGISSLAAGASSSATTNVTVPTTLAAGTYYIGAIGDYSNTVKESSETNNALTGQLITISAGPDLVITAVSGPASAWRGMSVSISNTIKNQGIGKATNSSSVGLYLSKDSVITTADTRVGTRTISSLAAGTTSTASTTVTIPSTLTVGTYYIGAIADYTNTVKENNETNNSRAGNTLVVQ